MCAGSGSFLIFDWTRRLRLVVVTVVSVVVIVVVILTLIVPFAEVLFLGGSTGLVSFAVPLVALFPPCLSFSSSSSLSSSSSFLSLSLSSFCADLAGLCFLYSDYVPTFFFLFKESVIFAFTSSYLSRKVLLRPSVVYWGFGLSWSMPSSTMTRLSSLSWTYSLKCSMPTPDSMRSIMEGIFWTWSFSASVSKNYPTLLFSPWTTS